MTQYNVYKIINDDMPGLVYYGSTMNTLNKRFFGHKNSKRYKSSKLFEIGQPKIIQLHVFDNELDMYKKEREYIENNECLNVSIPSLKKKDYSKGKIYKIVNDDFPDLVYYGSTITSLKKRFSKHKDNSCTSKKLFETNNVRVELVEDYPCETKRELETREKYYILKFECINRFVPAQTEEEKKEYIKSSSKIYRDKDPERYKRYYENNLEKLKIRKQIYYENEKEKIKLRNKNWRKKNPEKVKELAKRSNDKRRQVKYTCECGSTFNKCSKKEHERTKKHKNFLDTIYNGI